MHDVNASLVMLSHATEAGSDADRQKLTVDKYVHKKFKRIASASFDDNFGQEKHPNSVGTDIQLHINEPPLTTNDISQSVSSDQPDSDDIVSLQKVMEKKHLILFNLLIMISFIF